MGGTIANLLPLAFGIAMSPIPIVAVILTLLSPRAKITATGLAIGWVIGIVIDAVVFTALSSLIPESTEADSDTSAPIRGLILLALGALLLIVAMGQWRSRPRSDDEAQMPRWMSSVVGASFLGAFGLGLMLSTINPKNLIMGIAAGVAIGDPWLGVGPTIAVIAVYTAVAASTVIVPVAAYFMATAALTGPLNRLREWLTRYNSVIMSVLFFWLSISVISSGLRSF